MQPTTIPAVLLAIALLVTWWAAPGLLTAASAADESVRATAAERSEAPARQSPQDAGDGIAATANRAGEFLGAGYRRAPALMIVLSALLILPTAAILSFALQAAARRKTKQAASRAAQLRAATAEASSVAPRSDDGPLWSHQAWLTLQGAGAETLPLGGQTIRIGRHKDNDIRFPDTSVHRYHAVIEQTPDEAFVITDLSGTAGNGVRINGERLARAQLADGDIIELGRTRMKFESVPV
jgi:hypothetical protein